MSTTLRGLHKRVKYLEEELFKLKANIPAPVVLVTIDDIDSISVGSDTYTKQSSLLYQTTKDGIADQDSDGDDRYGHRVLSLSENPVQGTYSE